MSRLSKAQSASRPKRPGAGQSPKPGREPGTEPASAAAPAGVAGTGSGSPAGARISRRASDQVRGGHLWVYASEIESLRAGPEDQLLPVADNRGILLGTALYSPASQLALRMVSRELLSPPEWLALLARRLRAAIARRRTLLDDGVDACRLAFSEADELPGIVADKYGDIVILQLLAKGLDNAETRAVCVETIAAEFGGSLTVWERPDPRIRELEGLSAPSVEPLLATGEPLAGTVFQLNGLGFRFDVHSGQKTGAFLDQRQNYLAAERWAKARNAQRALDICTYQGGFALHLARVCRHVMGVDSSRAALEVAEGNLERNRGLLGGEVEWIEADAFDLLRAWSGSAASENAAWDLIVLDPPAFAKSKRAVEGALRGYKELNLRALRIAAPGGLLVTCSCSHHVTWADLESVVASAAADVHRRVKLLERRGAAADHPVVFNLPETEYLKCLVCEVD